MDILDRVATAGQELLGSVDATLLSIGAPADHAIWPMLRRVGALPGDVFESFCAMRAAPLLGAAAEFRRRAEVYADEGADLAVAITATVWDGDSAGEFTTRWRAITEHLGTSPVPTEESMVGRLAATASYLSDVAAWMTRARWSMACTAAECLGSLEAVHLRTSGGAASVRSLGPDGLVIVSAATIGALVLKSALREMDDAETVADGWAPRLADLPFRSGNEPGARFGGSTRVAIQ